MRVTVTHPWGTQVRNPEHTLSQATQRYDACRCQSPVSGQHRRGVCMYEYSYVHAHAYALVRVHVGVHVMLSLSLQDRLVVSRPRIAIRPRRGSTSRNRQAKRKQEHDSSAAWHQLRCIYRLFCFRPRVYFARSKRWIQGLISHTGSRAHDINQSIQTGAAALGY